MQKKIFDLKAIDVDASQRYVEFAFAETSKVDRDNDVFDQSAFLKSINERGPNGTNEIWHLLDHKANTFSALSKMSEVYMKGTYLAGKSFYRNTFAWREVAWPLYEAGDITQHSIGFEITDSEQKDGYRIIKQAAIWEGSAVLWGAQPDTPTMQVVKGILNMEDDRDITAAEKIDEIMKAMKKGRFDDDKSLLMIELKRLQTMFDQKQIIPLITGNSTMPVADTTLPGEIKGAFDTIINSLKTS